MANQYTVEKSSTFEGWRQRYNQLALDFESAGGDSLKVENLAGNAGDYDIPYLAEQAPSQFALIGDPNGDNRGNFAVDFQYDRNAVSQVASGNYSVLIGGRFNQNNGDSSFIGAGVSNQIASSSSAILGGTNNTASGDISVLLGGENNTALSNNSSIISSSGGMIDGASDWSIILAGRGNSIGDSTDSISTGQYNDIVVGRSVFISGEQNTIGSSNSGATTSVASSILGGSNNNIVAEVATIVGGLLNEITTSAGARGNLLGGGQSNTITGNVQESFVLGGNNNTLTDANRSSIISSTQSSITSGNNSSIFSGSGTTISAFNSTAIGQYIDITHDYSVVVGQGESGNKFSSSQIKELTLGFLNGVRIKGAGDDSVAGSLSIDGNDGQLTLYDTNGVSKTITANASNNSLKVGNDPLLSSRAERQTETVSFTLNEATYNSGQVFFVDSSSAQTVTLGAATDGYQAIVVRQGSGGVVFAADTGETVNSKVGASPSLSDQYAAATAIYQGGQWFVMGDIS